MSDEDTAGAQYSEEAPGSDPLRRLTDIANARRFVDQHGPLLRWVLSEKSWLRWDTRRWRGAAGEEVEALAKVTASTIWEEVTTAQGSDQRMDIARHAKQSESARAVGAMVRLARSDERIWVQRSDLDGNPHLFNCLNGTIDLEDIRLREHQAADQITKLAPIEYDSRARCQTWLQFLDRIMGGNRDLIAFLQRAAGYSLAGDVTEQCFFFLYGLGANGKSTFVETIRALLGDYARNADSTTFLVQRADNVRSDIARFAGARVVFAAEVARGHAMDENLVKQLTGGGMVTARHLFKDLFEFSPQFKIWIEGNHKPEIAGVDYATWRRIKLIPFNVTIPPGEQDPTLRDRLLRELPGILNWILAGYRAWRARGLTPPAKVYDAIDEYRTEMDPLGEFISDCCVLSPEQSIAKGDLFDWYRWWCQTGEAEPMKAKAFGTSIAERGIAESRTSIARYWVGIGIRPDARSDT